MRVFRRACRSVCAAVEAQEYLRHRNKRPTRFPDDTIGPSPLVQLIPMKVMLTLLLSCLVLMAHTHAMLQVHSWFRDHGDKAPRWPGKRPRSEVNACPRYHAFIDVCVFAGLISSSSAWLTSPDRCLERAPRDHQRPPMSPPDAILLFP